MEEIKFAKWANLILILLITMAVKPLIMFHGRSSAYGKPDSVESITRALKYSVDIIELDIRKSRDGVLFCYHGSWFAWVLRYLYFNVVKRNLRVDTLEEVLKVITTKKIIFLDIKDKRITAEDLSNVCGKFNQKYWIASRDLWYLGQLKSVLKDCKFVYNSGFVRLKNGLANLQMRGIDIIKVFRWQLTPNLKPHLLRSGLQFNIHPWFMDTKKYLEKVEKYGSVWVAYDDLEHLERPWIWS